MKRIPWFKLRKKTDPELPLRVPLPIGPLSNGEFFHPDNPRKKLIRKLILEKAEKEARRHGVDRREFLASAMGVCTSLYMINLVSSCGGGEDANIQGNGGSGGGGGGGGGGSGGSSPGIDGGAGGPFNIPDGAMYDEELAECVLGQVQSADGSDDFIVDMQSHFINPQSDFYANPLVGQGFLAFLNSVKSRNPWVEFLQGCTGLDCYSATAFMEHFFLDSDTTIGVLSGIPYQQCDPAATGCSDSAPLTNTEINDAKTSLNMMLDGRVLCHALVMPNDRIDVQLAAMEENASWGVDAWKTYPPWGSSFAAGYWLDDADTGVRMIEKGREVGVKVFCVHKGFPLSNFSTVYTEPREMGIVAKMFPDVTFVTYHSGFEHGLQNAQQGTPNTEGPYDPGGMLWPEDVATSYWPTVNRDPAISGVNSLIKSILDNGIIPNDPSVRLYAELGGTLPSMIMSRPTELQHVLGKLMKYLGEDRIVWGTDCLWFGSPRPIIEAFRTFQIPVEMQEKYGYPALTPERKAKILGINAARIHGLDPCAAYPEPVARLRRDLEGEFGPRRYMMMRTPGPRTWGQYLALQKDENEEKRRFSGRSFLRKGRI